MSNLSDQLHLAPTSRNVSMLEPLLADGAHPFFVNFYISQMSLHTICHSNNDRDDLALMLFKLSVFKPLQIDLQDEIGRTPLHVALNKGHKKVAALLLKRGADPTVAAHDGTTSLHVLAQLSRADNGDANSLLNIFIKNNPIKRFKRSLRVDGQDNLGNTALHYALENLDVVFSVWLLELTADFNAANNEGATPLHVMCDRMFDYDCKDFLKPFFKYANRKRSRVLINAKDRLGQTPLQLAVANVLPRTVKKLLDHGADLSNFVFPDRSYFAPRIDPEDKFFFDEKVGLAARALSVVAQLEKNGYKLDSSEARLTIMEFFAKHKLFEETEDLEECWYKDEEFVKEARKIMMKEESSPSLYDLILMEPKEAVKALTYWEFYKWTENSFSISKDYDKIWALHLCEKMSREIFYKWTLEPFRKLVHDKLSENCCNMVLKGLLNKNLYKICAVAAFL